MKSGALHWINTFTTLPDTNKGNKRGGASSRPVNILVLEGEWFRLVTGFRNLPSRLVQQALNAYWVKGR